MSKVYSYIVLSVFLVFLLKFAGLPTGADALLTYIGLTGEASGISMGIFFVAVGAIFTIGTAAGIAISFITKSPSETWILQGIAAGILTVITSTFVAIVNYTKDFGYIYYITWLIFIPLLFGFISSLIQWWRGGDG